jgi:CRP-like cAMP-binding protein
VGHEQSMGTKRIRIKVATTEDELFQAARLVYVVLVEEGVWLIPGADPLGRVVPLGAVGRVLIAVTEEGEVVGVELLQVFRSEDAPLELVQEYGLDEFYSRDPDLQVGVVSKLVVREDFRRRRIGATGATVSERLFGYTFGRMVMKRVPLVFFDCTPQMIGWYHDRIAAHDYWAHLRTRGLGVSVPMVVATFDLERFEKVGSPVAQLARANGVKQDNHGRDLIDAVSPVRPDQAPDERTRRMGTIREIDGGGLFEGMPETWLDELMAAVTVQTLEPGEVLLEPGVANDDFFVIKDGTADVCDPNTREVFATGIAGEPQGELSWQRGTPPTAVVRAAVEPGTPVEVYRIDGEALRRLIQFDLHPEAAGRFMAQLMEVWIKRAERATQTVKHHPDAGRSRSSQSRARQSVTREPSASAEPIDEDPSDAAAADHAEPDDAEM